MKNRMGKRIVSLFLALIMAVGVLPMSALAAHEIEVSGTKVNLDFGGEVDPNTVLDDKYDIKAVGSIQMKADINGTDKLMAEGRVELLVPYSIFEDMITEKIDAGKKDVVDAALKEYEDGITDALTKPVSFDETIQIIVSGVKVDVPVSFNGTPAEIIETIRSGKVSHEGVVYGYYHEYLDGGAEGALRTLASNAAEVAGVDLPTGVTPAGYSTRNWAKDTADASSNAGEQAEKLAAVIGLLWAQSNLSAEITGIIGSMDHYNGTRPNTYYKTKDEIKAELSATISNQVTNLIQSYVDSLLNTIETSFYGQLNPEYPEETLTGRFEMLCGEDGVVDEFIGKVKKALKGYDIGDLDSFEIDMPTGEISSLENMLKSIVKQLNYPDKDPALVEDPEIQGTIIGVDDTKLSKCYPTGMYVVAGVNSEDTDDMIYKPYVLAPAVAPVTIKNGDADMGYFLRATYGDTLNITANVASGYEADHLMQLRFSGVQTDGKVYDSDKNGGQVPTEAGVYTVFSLYFNEDTLAMGGDIAVLVIEPKEAEGFNLTEAEYEADGQEYFADITTGGQTVVKIAVNQSAPEAYVELPESFGDKAGAATDKAEDIVNRFETELEKYLPMPDRITAKILGGLAKLEDVADKADGPAKVTSTQVKDRLLTYIDAVTAWYSKDKAMDEAADAVEKVKTELETNETILKYQDMMKSVLEDFDLADFTAPKMRAAETPEQKLAKDFINKFMDEIEGNEDNVKALLTYIADYADNSSYKQDAVTLIKTLGAIGKVDTGVVSPAVTAVEGAFTTLKNDITALIQEIGFNVPTKEHGAEAMECVETFVKTVMGEAKKVVQAFNISTLYIGSMPTKAGVYDCYAVNVSTNYMPQLKKATLTLTAVESGSDVPTGTITNGKMSLELDGMVHMVLYAYIDGFDGINLEEKGGVVIWTGEEAPESGALLTVEDTENCISLQNMRRTDEDGKWMVFSDGIRAMDYGDKVYMRPYVEVAQGEYVYPTGAKALSPATYCTKILTGEYGAELKEVCAALLQYGAAAQVYFGDEDDLVNEGVDLSDYDLTFDESMLDATKRPDAAKANTLDGRKEKVGSLSITLSLDTGAIVMVAYCSNLELADSEIESAELFFWTEEQYESVDVLDYDDPSNYSYKKVLERGAVIGDDRYAAFSELIPAAECGDTLYISARFVTKTGDVYRSGLNYPSPDKYVEQTNDPVKYRAEHVNLVQALAVYSEKAYDYFN